METCFCSDGMTSTVADPDIARIVLNQADRRGALKSLIDMANQAGGEDNITALSIDCYAV